MLETDNLMTSLIFSSIGMGYFIYGKKQKKLVPLLCGIGLMGYTYFVSSLVLLLALGVVLLAIPYFVKY